MIEWWNSLSTILQVFYGMGGAALLLTLLQIVLAAFGIGADALDVDFDIGAADGDGGTGASLFSMQTLSAFFLGFGWFGAALLSAGVGLLIAIVAAFAVGVVVMFAAYFLVRGLLRLQSSGNKDYRTAIGQEATVYVTLPGNDEDGGGQIEVMIQGRLCTVAARKPSLGSSRPGEKVRITGMFAQTTFTVEPIVTL